MKNVPQGPPPLVRLHLNKNLPCPLSLLPYPFLFPGSTREPCLVGWYAAGRLQDGWCIGQAPCLLAPHAAVHAYRQPMLAAAQRLFAQHLPCVLCTDAASQAVIAACLIFCHLFIFMAYTLAGAIGVTDMCFVSCLQGPHDCWRPLLAVNTCLLVPHDCPSLHHSLTPSLFTLLLDMIET
jgi:hypothetical protein